MKGEVSTLAPWFGGNRLGAANVGRLLAGSRWVGIPFAGGMAELWHLDARQIVVNDRHRHVINLARVAADDDLRPVLVRRLARKLFHPIELAAAQATCRAAEPGPHPDLELAEAYFVCCWMGRSHKAGIDDEFNGRPAVRWNANGGGSLQRYRSALRMLVTFGRIARRCEFETIDGFAFLDRCEDAEGHAVYSDSPFPDVGLRYRHNAGETRRAERAWHRRLARRLSRFGRTRVVARFYDHELVRELYPETEWAWHFFDGRKQSNDAAPEILLVRN